MQSNYGKFYLYNYAYCKSAGTLIAIASDRIIMHKDAEFGPLDVQIRNDEGMYKSALDFERGWDSIKDESWAYFAQRFSQLRECGYPIKLAAQIARNVTSDLFEPILATIDPATMGNIRRSQTTIVAYGERLVEANKGNISQKKIVDLAYEYPDHAFVIDRDESSKFFTNIEIAEK